MGSDRTTFTLAALALLTAAAVRADNVAPPAPAAPAAPTAPTAAQPPTPAPISAETASYLFGLNLGQQLRRAGLNQEVSVDAVARGAREGLSGKDIGPAEQQQLGQYVRSTRENAGLRNHAAAKTFLAGNASQKGIKTTASGLQYRVLSPGDPKKPSPKADDRVTVQYRGKLLDGSEFDSSYAHGRPAVFQVGRVIKGWQEALPLMKPGAKWQLFVPPELAYDLNSPPGIPPGSLLQFEIELLSVEAAPSAGATPGTIPGAMPGATPGAKPGAMPGTMSGAATGAAPAAPPGAGPGAPSGAAPGAPAGPGSGAPKPH